MDKLPRLSCVLISAFVLFSGVARQSVAASLAGDIAPFGAPDGDVNVADLDLLRQFVSGDAVPILEQQSLADLAPLNSPDGVLNIADIVVMEQAILNLVTLPPPTLAISSPYLWGSDLVTTPYYVSGLALANATINIYRDGKLLSTVTSNSNGLFSAGVDLIAGAASVIYVKAEYNGIESAASNTLSPVLPVTIPAADPGLITTDYSNNGLLSQITGAPGAVTGGATVIVQLTDGTEHLIAADNDGSFNKNFLQIGSSVASITVSDGNGNESEPVIVTAVGTLAGTFDVEATGAATYSIPIAAPPGTAGMAPSLSINYNSNGGNGTLGHGWSLGGLSVISRCPRTIAQDGSAGRVNVDSNDRFCLDGQRLIAINGGAYGADGTEYRTEVESFTKVVSYGGSGTSPDSFTVWTKPGQVIHFGGTGDAQFNPQGADVLLWAVNRVEDKIGNYIVVTYHEDTVLNEHYPEIIEYTLNDNAGLSTANNKVLLVYEPRPDTSAGYVGGVKVTSTRRLRNIQVFEGPDTVREYRLSYDTSPVSGMSRLRSITECNSAVAEAACLLPTKFNWSDGATGYMSGVTSGSTNSGFSYAKALDVDGDGLQDLVVPHHGSWWINYGASSGLLQEASSSISTAGSYLEYSLPIDYNGDGLTDLLVPGSDGFWDLLESGSNGFSLTRNLIPNEGYNVSPQVLDINGDGLQDMVVMYNSGLGLTRHIYLNTYNGFQAVLDTGLSRMGNNTKIVDYDNDGKQDLLDAWYLGRQACEFRLFSFDGQDYKYGLIDDIAQDNYGNNAGCLSTSFSDRNSWFSDFNGDGLQDLVYVDLGTGGTWNAVMNTGEGLDSQIYNLGLGSNYSYYSHIDDYNGDGKSDFVLPHDGISWHVYQSAGGSLIDVPTGLAGNGYKDARLMDVNGDGLQDIVSPYNGVWNVHLRQGSVPDQLTGITNGLGVKTQITYKPLTDKTTYTRGASASLPEQNVQAPLYVVSQTSIDDGAGGQYLTDYSYAGAKLHLQGRGLLGFSEVTSSDPQTGIHTTTTYRQDFPYTGMATRSESFLDGQLISRAENTLAEVVDINGASGVHFPYISESAAVSYDLPDNGVPGALIKTTLTATTYDNYGNPLTVNVDTINPAGHMYTRLTANTYDIPDLANWVLDRVNRTSVLHQVPGMTAITKTSGFSYYSNGLLKDEIIEPDAGPGSPQYLKTTYGYDAFGNKTKVTVTGLKGYQSSAGTESRTTETIYDARGRFPLRTINALGHEESYTHDPRFGVKTSLLGPNGLNTTWAYDGFGRKLREIRADGTETAWSYEFCKSTDCSGGGFIETVMASGSAPGITYHDALQRVIRTETVSLTGQTIYQDTAYDPRGNVASRSRSFFAGGNPQTTTFSYDELDRPLLEQSPDGGIVEYVYTGYARNTHRHHTSGDYDQHDTRVNDAMDQLVSVVDAMGGSQSYTYDAAGNLVVTTDSDGNAIQTAYDLRGRKLLMIDPDMGLWQYKYNAFGELVWQKDARGQVVNMAYDELGRMTTRTEPEGSSTWSYDTATMGVGKLALVSYAASGHTSAYTYDSLGRLASETSSIDGENFVMAYTYDGFSRRETITYPSGFMVRNRYNASGHLVELRDAVNDSRYWQALEDDAEGHITIEDLGNGLQTVRNYDPANGSIQSISTGAGTGAAVQNLIYQFDALGNLRQRQDLNQTLTETFLYDDLNRLTESAIARVGSRNYGYDALGNITRKSDYGDAYIYGAGTAGPHAVTEVKNGGISQASYTYDANGNMTGGAGRSISWTSFNKAASISKGTTTLGFAYDAGHNRVKQVDGTRITYYLNPRLDVGETYQKIQDGGTAEHMHYVQVGNRAVAIYTRKDDGTEKTRYLHTDHLGSTDVITDENGKIVEQQSFSPFGSRRNTNWSSTTSVLAGLETQHGFTGHEHLDEVGIIHMNGRLYDPQLGRYLSPDIQVQYPDQTQSFNRYTYVNNNPLSFTDPSGYGFFSKLWKKIRRLVAVVVAVAVTVWTLGFTALLTGNIYIAAAAAGFVGGFTFGVIATGNLQSAFQYGLVGANLGLAMVSAYKLGSGIINRAKNFFDLASRPVGSFGGPDVAAVHLAQDVAYQYANYFKRRLVSEFAERNNLSLEKLNAALLASSVFGNVLVGSRYRSEEGFIVGLGNRRRLGGPTGWVFDAVDTVLVYQGIPSASGWHYVFSENAGRPIAGHSLGAAEVHNLVGLGFAESGRVASLPFGNIAPSGVDVTLSAGDPVNFFGFGKLTSWGAKVVNGGFFKHSRCSAYPTFTDGALCQ